MPIAAADLVQYGSANRPSDDTSTAGGAIATATRLLDSQLSANSVVAVVSDGADTRTVTIEGRLASGAIDTEALVLNGTTEVVGAKTFERILKLTTTSSGTRQVTVRQGAGGTTRHTIKVNETEGYIHFQRSVSESAQAVRYEKDFFKNTHGSLALTSAALKLTADPDARIKIGAAPSVDDSATVANRKTAPASVTFVDDGVSQGVPGGSLAAGAAIGWWSEQTLAASDSARRSTYTVEISGQTT